MKFWRRMNTAPKIRLAFAVSLLLFTATTFARPLAKMTVKVLDEGGKPVPDANVTLCFAETPPKELRKGLTNRDGVFTATAPCASHVICSATKEGYYYSVDTYWFKGGSLLHWTPWNPTCQLILKKRIQPIPMYARDVQIDIPELGKLIGYDLIEADWVAPYGKGKTGDFVFQIAQTYRGRDDFEATMNLTFTNVGDGIQPVAGPPPPYNGSELRLSQNAPADGYEKQWTARRQSSPDGTLVGRSKEDRYFYFRVRSVRVDGQTTKSFYGKIHGDIEWCPESATKAWLKFCYYLNPDGTRNVEFDPKRNLSKDLKLLEGVNQP